MHWYPSWRLTIGLLLYTIAMLYLHWPLVALATFQLVTADLLKRAIYYHAALPLVAGARAYFSASSPITVQIGALLEQTHSSMTLTSATDVSKSTSLAAMLSCAVTIHAHVAWRKLALRREGQSADKAGQSQDMNSARR